MLYYSAKWKERVAHLETSTGRNKILHTSSEFVLSETRENLKASLYFLDTMSDNIVSDIHVCVGGEEEKEFMSVTTEKEQDGVTKMSWITKVNIIELEKNVQSIMIALLCWKRLC